VGGKLYVIGGYDANAYTTGDVQVFDGVAWISGPALPNPTDHVSAAVAGGRLYVVGGNQLSGTTAAIYALNPDGSGWTKIGDLTQPRAAFALVSVAGKLIALGGYGSQGNNLSTVETYDPATNTSVTNNALLPFPRNHVAGFSYQGMACVAGGRSGGVTYARVDCYNPTLNAWQQLPDLPAATAGEAASATPGGAIVLGGEDAGETYVVTQLFRLVGGSWTAEPMLSPRHGMGAAILGGRLWVPGGAEVPGRAPVNLCTSVPL
jgi:N-acetylneuraminic acid mutarotase